MTDFSIKDFSNFKSMQKKITMVTAYDYTSAQILESAAIDTILVGDSLGMVIQGKQNTMEVTIEDILYHTKSVRTGAPNSFIIADMPYLSYHFSPNDTIKNAAKLICHGAANAVKLEINHMAAIEHIKALISAQIPVIGHIGMTPQSVNMFGGFKVQGKTNNEALHILELAKEVERSGASAIVLECIPAHLAEEITETLTIPTIGIGAGNSCDGQVLVFHDLIGLTDSPPKFVKSYCNAKEILTQSIETFANEVMNGIFPEVKHSFTGTIK
ncbi:MAG: 3-methyl-2-oxobutanoate hydroxymethyltransferase [Burkholderiales bacterium]|nr:3-methyl-2-oxobutanoate hydroxymethyltransferase [Burkholderiales bacterium]